MSFTNASIPNLTSMKKLNYKETTYTEHKTLLLLYYARKEKDVKIKGESTYDTSESKGETYAIISLPRHPSPRGNTEHAKMLHHARRDEKYDDEQDDDDADKKKKEDKEETHITNQATNQPNRRAGGREGKKGHHNVT